MNKTFKGKLADGEELRIRLTTNDGLTGYKIVKFQLFPTNYNVTDEYNSSVWQVNPQENLCILFPANLEHFVKPNLNKERRISISFNYGI